MNAEVWTVILFAALTSGTPLLFAALGELITERVGVLNLGVEGMMLLGASSAYVVAVATESQLLGFLTGMLVAGCLGLLHALLTVTLRVDQVVSGLGVTIFGTGFSAYLGRNVIGQPNPGQITPLAIPGLANLPIIGRGLFQHDVIVYGGMLLAVAIWFLLYRTRFGLRLRAVGESPGTADAMGVNVIAYRYVGVLVGALLAGLGGAYLSLVYAPSWGDNLTAGRGWIAIALVIFARWEPLPAMMGAYVFGGIEALSFGLQAAGVKIPANFLRMLPYVLTIVVLMARRRSNAPQLTLNAAYDREVR